MGWIILFISAIFEIIWATGIKYADGFTQLWPTIITIVVGIFNMWLLSLAMRYIPLGTAYPAWIGIGAVGTVAVGIVLQGEPVTGIRLASVAIIIIGVIGLNIESG